jgi:hypothetical protein
MYIKLKGLKVGTTVKIPCSPPWKILKAYGGHMEIEEYRNSIEDFYFLETSNIKRPLLFSCNELIEERKVAKEAG